MNTTQLAVATALGAAHRRQWRTMARQGPIAQIEADQRRLNEEVMLAFTVQSPGFDRAAFMEAVQASEHDHAYAA